MLIDRLGHLGHIVSDSLNLMAPELVGTNRDNREGYIPPLLTVRSCRFYCTGLYPLATAAFN